MNTPVTSFNSHQFLSGLVSSKLHLHHLGYFEANLRSNITSSANISVGVLKDRDAFLKNCARLLLPFSCVHVCARIHACTHTQCACVNVLLPF